MIKENPKRTTPRSQRLLLYTIAATFTVTFIFFAIDLGLAWIFVSRLIYPECQDPQRLPELRHPEEHWLATQDGHLIRIWYYPPQNSAAIISLGGLNGALGNQIPQVESLINEGYGVVQVDSRACAVPSAPVTLGGFELLDAEAALKFLKTQSEVDADRIGTIGFSMGGATAIRLAARHPEIQAVVRDGGYSNLGEMLAPSEEVSIQQKVFQNTLFWLFNLRTGVDPMTVSPIHDLGLVSPRPVLLIYGEAEAELGRNQFQAAGVPKELWIVPGSTHGRNHVVAAEEYENRLLFFFNQSLLK
jgi:dipeptidyl aminopeptidase/acylaminoacyl peptidase